MHYSHQHCLWAKSRQSVLIRNSYQAVTNRFESRSQSKCQNPLLRGHDAHARFCDMRTIWSSVGNPKQQIARSYRFEYVLGAWRPGAWYRSNRLIHPSAVDKRVQHHSGGCSWKQWGKKTTNQPPGRLADMKSKTCLYRTSKAWPQCEPGVIVVGNTDKKGKINQQSCYGPCT